PRSPHFPYPTLFRSQVRLATAGERLAFLAPHLLIFVANALALVRLRLADGPHLGGVLPDLLLVRAADDDGVGVRHLDRDTLRRKDRKSTRLNPSHLG